MYNKYINWKSYQALWCDDCNCDVIKCIEWSLNMKIDILKRIWISILLKYKDVTLNETER